MIVKLISFFLLLTEVRSFAPVPSRSAFGVATRQVGPTVLSMFSGDEPKGLEEVTTPMVESNEISTEEIPAKGAPKAVYRNLAKGGEEVQVPWVDDAMRANTNPLEMSWWAYILFGLPVILLANDFLHFLPKEGPLAFISTL